jgi:hypothetical protein
MLTRRRLAALAVLGLALAAASCGGSSSSGPAVPTIHAARTYHLGGFRPVAAARPGRATDVAFTIVQPSGQPLTRFRRGPGPHTGVHLIIVRSDLGTIIHRHPPVGADGRVSQPIDFPTPGRYRVVVDAYPATGQQRNFQLFDWIRVAGQARRQPLPPFSPTVTVDGYRFTLHGRPKLRAIDPAFLTVTVTDPQGRPATFTPWYGALAHAIFFRAGSLDYFHTHVCSPGASGCTSILAGSKVTGSSSTPGKLTVGVLVPVAGTWRLFLQVQVQGHILTATFTLHVR